MTLFRLPHFNVSSVFIYSLPKECSEILSLQPVAHVMVVETIKLEAFKATTGILMPKLVNFNKM